MKKVFVSLFLFLAAYIQAEDSSIVEDYKAVFYVNQSKMVCGVVYQVKDVKKQTYLNLGGIYPNHKIAVLIWSDNMPMFTEKFGALSSLKDQRICVRGTITEYKNKLQIVARDPNFLRLMKK